MKYYFKKELYSKEALLKAAYTYIDDYYVHLDADDEQYIVDVSAKDEGNDNLPSTEAFVNEMLIQEMRAVVWKKTNNIRELIYARALASTIIDKPADEIAEDDYDPDADSILKDWFDDEK